jgi:hypothetical protein
MHEHEGYKTAAVSIHTSTWASTTKCVLWHSTNNGAAHNSHSKSHTCDHHQGTLSWHHRSMHSAQPTHSKAACVMYSLLNPA